MNLLQRKCAGSSDLSIFEQTGLLLEAFITICAKADSYLFAIVDL